MLNRRHVLAAATVLAALPGAASAQRRNPRGKGKDPAPTGTPATTPLGPLDTAAKYALIMDFHTGATLLDKEGDAPMPPSSMTKLMTAYIVYGMLKSGRMTLTQELPVSERAWRMQGSKMFVPLGGTVKIEDLIRGVIVQSGNDACIVLAEAVAGSEEGFADLMNIKAKELGLTTSNFRNSTGWPDPAQRMSCRDIATLARRLITDFPEYYKYDNEKSYKYNGIEQQNRIAGLERDRSAKRKALEAEMRAANVELAKAYRATHAYSPAVQAAIDHFHRAMAALQKDTVMHVIAMRSVLRPDQTAAFDDSVERSLTGKGS